MSSAKELGEPVQAVKAFVSANLMKNGMGVMVPGTGMPGLAIAAAVGALGGDANAGLQVLKSLTPDVVAQGKQMVADGKMLSIHKIVPFPKCEKTCKRAVIVFHDKNFEFSIRFCKNIE